MAKLLSQLETGIRHNLRVSSFSVTGAAEIESASRVMRGLSGALPWPELRRSDTTTTTTANVGAYNWPTAHVWLDVTVVEIQDGDDGDKYKPIYPPQSERTWSAKASEPSRSVPDHYLRFSIGITEQFELRPAPKYGSKIVKVTGIVEPPDFVSANSKSLFLQKAADDALEHLIAADWLFHDGITEYGNTQMEKAGDILGRLFGKEKVPQELLRSITTG